MFYIYFNLYITSNYQYNLIGNCYFINKNNLYIICIFKFPLLVLSIRNRVSILCILFNLKPINSFIHIIDMYLNLNRINNNLILPYFLKHNYSIKCNNFIHI